MRLVSHQRLPGEGVDDHHIWMYETVSICIYAGVGMFVQVGCFDESIEMGISSFRMRAYVTNYCCIPYVSVISNIYSTHYKHSLHSIMDLTVQQQI